MILPGKVNITINDLNSFLLNKLQMVVTGAGAKTTAGKWLILLLIDYRYKLFYYLFSNMFKVIGVWSEFMSWIRNS